MPDLKTIGAALAWGRAATLDSESSSLAAQVLLARLLGVARAWLLAHPETALAAEAARAYAEQVARLAAGEPLAYLTGEQEFYGLAFAVSPQVLVPRPETELLVDEARAILEVRTPPERLRVAEVGTGSGCVAVALAVMVPRLSLVATEIAPGALRLARVNAQRHGVAARIRFVRTDLMAALARGLDLVCANLPYIPTRALAGLAVAQHEPQRALDGGPDGLDPTRRLLAQAQNRMNPGGALLLEIEETHGQAILGLAQRAFPRAEHSIRQDLAGRDRLLRIDLP
ncbi:MAG: peptide chain release factor N(5)-glutamine methyltransferase [Chloroflexi bacterium]|nr:peptide chain release factor N(5)-glutamine methyltransferase [Chloroflexota bacterium]